MTHPRRLISLLLPCLLVACAPVQTQPVVGGPSASPTPSALPSVAPSASQAPTVATFALSGKVFDESTASVAGATVTAQPSLAGASPVSAITGTDGGYTLSLPAGPYTITATKPSWTTRSQSVTLAANMTLNFGGSAAAYFLSDTPEIASTVVKEDAPGGPLTVVCKLSEPITTDAQKNFTDRFFIDSNGKPFLRANVAFDPVVANTAAWDTSGQVFTLHYAGHYLPSGAATQATYQVHLRQSALTTHDPVTNETNYEDMGIVDLDGKAIGYQRAAYAFVQTALAIDPADLNNTAIANSFPVRAWRLTHQSNYSFNATKDTLQPGLISARVLTEQPVDNGNYDVLELHLNKPMFVVKDLDNEHYTMLDKLKNLLSVRTSGDASGTGAQALPAGNTVAAVRYSLTDPNVVFIDYPRDAFLNAHWVDVTLGADFLDPAGNLPDPKANHLTINPF